MLSYYMKLPDSAEHNFHINHTILFEQAKIIASSPNPNQGFTHEVTARRVCSNNGNTTNINYQDQSECILC